MAEDWRKKYLHLADEIEREQASHADAERQLIRLLTRLCVATSGLDPVLDPHIDRVRVAAKGKAGALLAQADEIGDTLVRAADERSQPGVLQRLLERGTLNRRQHKEALSLWASIATDPAAADDAKLDRLGELIRTGLPKAAEGEERGAGLFSRLLGKGVADGSDGGPNRHLLDVIRAVPWPEGLQSEVTEFEEALSDDAPPDAWIGIVRRIGDLAVQAMESAQQSARDAERFLTELNRQLEELDQHMLDESDRREASRVSGERLGQQMDSEVDSLSDSVRESNDLAELQASILGSLQRMQSHVRTHLQDENARRDQAESESEVLRSQLHQLEKETFDLRRQVARTRDEAMLDPLTGLPNRRAYEDRIQQEYARWRRFGEPLTLIVWDIDDFKKINDTFGHKAGDRVLVMVGKLLRERLRETDFIARYGGEEIVVLLVGAGPEDAGRLADGMCRTVENGGLHAHGKPVRVTLSGGLLQFSDDDTPDIAFERADAAMYQAKKKGKNRVVVADQ